MRWPAVALTAASVVAIIGGAWATIDAVRHNEIPDAVFAAFSSMMLGGWGIFYAWIFRKD
jgi:hypothetical protein